jgi:hypothetical protein
VSLAIFREDGEPEAGRWWSKDRGGRGSVMKDGG